MNNSILLMELSLRMSDKLADAGDDIIADAFWALAQIVVA